MIQQKRTGAPEGFPYDSLWLLFIDGALALEEMLQASVDFIPLISQREYHIRTTRTFQYPRSSSIQNIITEGGGNSLLLFYVYILGCHTIIIYLSITSRECITRQRGIPYSNGVIDGTVFSSDVDRARAELNMSNVRRDDRFKHDKPGQ